ncbi:MAG TPA: transposase [Trebonia sp.]
MRRSYKFLLRPTKKQEAALSACLEDIRQLYNAALEERREAWRMGRRQVTFYSQSAQLKEIRADDSARYGRWSFDCERSAIRRLDRAFQGFYRRVKAGKKPGYPRFKGRGWWDSIEWPAVRGGACWDSAAHPNVARVYFKGIGHVRVHQHRPVKGQVKTITVKREADRWYVVLSCNDVPTEPLEPTGALVGIDLGVTSFLTTSDGKHVPNPRYLAATSERLAASQRDLSLKKRGSNRRKKTVAKVARLHGKVRRQRLDHAHSTALALVRAHDLIVHEDLKIANLTRRPRPRPDGGGGYEPNGGAAKAGLNKSIHDAGWGIFLRILSAKAESAGRTVIAVDPRHSSQQCAQCGHIAVGNRVSQAEFRCLACGHQANADVNAAQNILRAGLALQEAGMPPEKLLLSGAEESHTWKYTGRRRRTQVLIILIFKPLILGRNL